MKYTKPEIQVLGDLSQEAKELLECRNLVDAWSAEAKRQNFRMAVEMFLIAMVGLTILFFI